MTRLHILIATGFGIGRSPVAPGTFGSIPGVFLGLWVARGLHENPLYFATLLAGLLAIGLWSVIVYERVTGVHDDQRVVIDEVMGLALSFLPCAWLVPQALASTTLPAMLVALTGFALFRLFDIWKPGPVGWIDRNWHSPLGTYLDDLVAGLMAAWVLAMLLLIFGN